MTGLNVVPPDLRLAEVADSVIPMPQAASWLVSLVSQQAIWAVGQQAGDVSLVSKKS